MIKKNMIILLAIVISAVLVTGSFSYLYLNSKRNTYVPEGPAVNAHATLYGVAPSVSLINGTPQFYVSIYSIVPYSIRNGGMHLQNITGMNQTNNPYEDMLFQESSYTLSINGNMNIAIYNISREWESVSGNDTLSVSLMVYSYYQYVYNGKLYVYQYYNNLPYQAGNISNTINLNITFNLNNPAVILPVVSVPSINKEGYRQQGIIGNGNCHDETVIVNQTTESGPLPVMSAFLKLPSNSELAYYFASFNNKITESFNSVSATAGGNNSYSTTVVSSSPSWSGTDNSANYSGVSSYSDPISGYNMSMIYIPDVTYNVINTKTYYYFPDGRSCEYDGYSHSTSISIVNINSNDFSFKVGFLQNIIQTKSSAVSQMWWAIFNAMGYHEIYSKALPAGDNINALNYAEMATGYTNAADAEKTAVNAVSALLTGIGVGLTLAVASSVVPGESTAADVVLAVEVQMGMVGLALDMISAFSSISYSTTTQLNFNAVGVSNMPIYGSGSSLSIGLYQSSHGSSLAVNGSTYNFNLPASYITAVPG